MTFRSSADIGSLEILFRTRNLIASNLFQGSDDRIEDLVVPFQRSLTK